ncbi:MAG: fibrillarin-like rRNA/tRNA 2'-O-methyltransferase [Candidatus Aenigmarchaeota archaeon]|nr:fibrillarin-like rRNA/tRNA 2'-O-methyltransferase [Candidatus Aenigmarchaeota archaeon]
MKEIFPGIFRKGNELYTVNAVPGKRVYGEKLTDNYREWIPDRSKLASAILCGLKEMPVKPGAKIVYLGASTGTTVSHVSDIIGLDGIVYAVEFAERVMRKLMDVAKDRKNIVPILADARKPEDYSWVEECDVVYVDVADPQETELSLRNAEAFLKKGGYMLIAVKSQSIDVTKDPKLVFKEESEKLKDYKILQIVDIDKYQKDHALVVAVNQ